MEAFQNENSPNPMKTMTIEAQMKSVTELNGQRSAEITTTPSHVRATNEHREERRSSTDKPKTEERQMPTNQNHVVEKAEDDEVTKCSGDKEKRTRTDRDQTEEEPEAKRPKVPNEEKILGRGVSLIDIPAFVANYSAIKPTSASIRKLYKALFNAAGKPQTRRDEILQWSGIGPDASTEDLFTSLSVACNSADLIEIGKKYLGLQSGAGGKSTKRAWCEAISEILADPQPEKIELASAADSSRKRTSMKGGPGGYQAWCRDNREALKAKYPDLGRKEFLHAQSEAWKAIGDEEKEKYLGHTTTKKASPKRRGKPRKSKYEEDDDEPVEASSHEEDDETHEEESEALDDDPEQGTAAVDEMEIVTVNETPIVI